MAHEHAHGPAAPRLARTEDLAAILAIYNATIPARTSTAETVPVTVAQRAAWFAAHDPARRPLWVTERDGVVAGWLSLEDWNARAGYAKTAEVSVYVDPEHRRFGVGGLLLDHALAEAPALGISTLLAVLFADNEPSRALFRGRGFAAWGMLHGAVELDGARRDVAILGRELNSGRSEQPPRRRPPDAR